MGTLHHVSVLPANILLHIIFHEDQEIPQNHGKITQAKKNIHPWAMVKRNNCCQFSFELPGNAAVDIKLINLDLCQTTS